jgi:hypothetical protein
MWLLFIYYQMEMRQLAPIFRESPPGGSWGGITSAPGRLIFLERHLLLGITSCIATQQILFRCFGCPPE